MQSTQSTTLDAIIIGGSFAGLSAAMALGRALRHTLILDTAQPCNQVVQQAHNLITHDGANPAQITAIALEQVLAYPTVHYHRDKAISAEAHPDTDAFTVRTANGDTYTARRLLFATGVRDILPAIPGFAECWGNTILYCPYCHGYEFRHQHITVLADGENAIHMLPLIRQWSTKLTLLTNGPTILTPEQLAQVQAWQVPIIQTPLHSIHHQNGHIQHVQFIDQTTHTTDALYTRVPFQQHCDIPATLGCALTDIGHLQVDHDGHTTVRNIFAAGDAISPFRSLAIAIASGTKAAAFLNASLIQV